MTKTSETRYPYLDAKQAREMLNGLERFSTGHSLHRHKCRCGKEYICSASGYDCGGELEVATCLWCPEEAYQKPPVILSRSFGEYEPRRSDSDG